MPIGGLLQSLAGKPSSAAVSGSGGFFSFDEETIDNVMENISFHLNHWNDTPKLLFETMLLSLLVLAVVLKVFNYITATFKEEFVSELLMKETKPQPIVELERKYLPVFWLLRMAFWMSGAYFYPVYASKKIMKADGELTPVSSEVVRQIFLVGFLSAAMFLPRIGQAVDRYGRKTGTIVAAVIYGLGALSTKSDNIWVLFVGRALGGMGTGLLTTIPEAWLAAETSKLGCDPYQRWLGGTYSLAYSLDSIVAIIAGQLASVLAEVNGPTGPFEVSPTVLMGAIVLITFFWDNNVAMPVVDKKSGSKSAPPTVYDSYNLVLKDSKILMVGGVQSLFEAAMYIFVMQWAPALSIAVKNYYTETSGTPYGTVFCCFMGCCLIGSILQGQLAEWAFRTERTTTAMIVVSSLALASVSYLVTFGNGNILLELLFSFALFETCVGLYFPSIGWLRSKYIPDSHRASIMSLFSVPFNLMVVIISISIQTIGVGGAWLIASMLLMVAAGCLIKLQQIAKQEAVENLPRIWTRAKYKWMALARIIKIRKMINLCAKEIDQEETTENSKKTN